MGKEYYFSTDTTTIIFQAASSEPSSTQTKASIKVSALPPMFDSDSDSDGEFLGFSVAEIKKSEQKAKQVKERNDRLIKMLDAGEITVEEIDGKRKSGL